MPRHLCFSVTFLDPLFHGKGDNDEPEWPPSPMRLFQALVAGSRSGCRNARWSTDERDPLRAAFLWLERQEPPKILTPEATLASVYTLAVPNNDSDKEFERQDRLTLKSVRPHLLAASNYDDESLPVVTYLWTISDDDWPTVRQHTEILCGEVKNLMALGWGIDQVVGSGRILRDVEVERLPGEVWEPWQHDLSGRCELRVPKQGSLRALEEVYESFRTRLDGAVYRPQAHLTEFDFDKVRYVGAASFPYRPYAVFEMPEGTAFRQESIITVAAMLRSLACRNENRRDFEERFGGAEVYLAGHTSGEKHTPPRFSYLPLPTIGHRHSDGMVRRLLIAESYGGDGLRARWAERRLSGQALRDKQGNELGRLLELWRKTSGDMVRRYAGEGKTWSTVTPAILPGYDDGKLAKAEKLFLQAIEQAGLSTDGIKDLTMRKAPFWAGSQHSNHYLKPRYLKHLPSWHVQLTFRGAALGPLALGAGRHVGLGLMAISDM